MSTFVIESVGYTNTATSVLIATGKGSLLGIFVASGSSPTIKLWDSLTAANSVIVNTFTPNTGVFTPIPANFATGLFITIGGTVDVTVFWNR